MGSRVVSSRLLDDLLGVVGVAALVVDHLMDAPCRGPVVSVANPMHEFPKATHICDVSKHNLVKLHLICGSLLLRGNHMWPFFHPFSSVVCCGPRCFNRPHRPVQNYVLTGHDSVGDEFEFGFGNATASTAIAASSFFVDRTRPRYPEVACSRRFLCVWRLVRLLSQVSTSLQPDVL